MSVSKKIRFEVLSRDGNCCQYCGQKPPYTILEVDHILPKSKGGLDIMDNLITACFDCNRGKGANEIGTGVSYKTKINDNIIRVKSKFYEIWNSRSLGRLDDKTSTLLSIYLNDELGGDAYKRYLNSEYFYPIKGFSNLDTIFKEGGEYCNHTLYLLERDVMRMIEEFMEEIIYIDGLSAILSESEKLNYALSNTYINNMKSKSIYAIRKFTLFPNIFLNVK